MGYIIKQKFFTLGDQFTIEDLSGRTAYIVKGKPFSIGSKLSFQDPNGNELLYINQKAFSFGPAFEIYRDGQLFATAKKELFTVYRTRFIVDVPGPYDYEVEGDYEAHNFRFIRDGEVVAVVSKQMALTDSYQVEIVPDENDEVILAGVIVIDLSTHSGSSEELHKR